MAGARVRFVGEAGLDVEGFGRIIPSDSGLAAPLGIAGAASLTSLRDALRRWCKELGVRSERVWFVDGESHQVGDDPDYWPRESVELDYWDFPEDPSLDGLSVSITSLAPDVEDSPDQEIVRICTPRAQRSKALVTQVVTDDQQGVELAYITVRFASLRNRTVRDAYELGNDLISLIDASLTGSLTHETALDLLRAGRPDLLIGQGESGWLECKRAPYLLSEERQRFELAKDVAALANADSGGLIVIGAAARRDDDGREFVRSLSPFPAGLAKLQSYRAAIGNRVYPPVADLEIFRASASGAAEDENLLVLSVPPQDEALKPFLVRGAVVGGRLNDSYISLVTRHADHIRATEVAVIHSLLAAGRAALSGSFQSWPNVGLLDDGTERP